MLHHMPRNWRVPLGWWAGADLSPPAGPVPSPGEEGLATTRRLLLFVKGEGACGRESRPELRVFSKGLVALVTACRVSRKNPDSKLMKPAVQTARCSEANQL